MEIKRIILPPLLLILFIATLSCTTGTIQIHTDPIPMTEELITVAEEVCNEAFIKIEYIGEGNWYRYKRSKYATLDGKKKHYVPVMHTINGLPAQKRTN